MRQITLKKYNKIMDKVISQGKDLSTAEQLIRMIEEARKYEIIEEYPYEICSDCGGKYGKFRDGVATFHEGVCGWCGLKKWVTEPRDYVWPPFPIKKQTRRKK